MCSFKPNLDIMQSTWRDIVLFVRFNIFNQVYLADNWAVYIASLR